MKNNNISEEEVFEEIQVESSRINRNDIDKIISEEKKIIKKSSKLELNKFTNFIKQIRLAISLLKDYKDKKYTDIPWRSIALLSAAILYFVNPFDLVPDLLPFFGITDDALLFATVFKSIQSDLEKYREWKNLKS